MKSTFGTKQSQQDIYDDRKEFAKIMKEIKSKVNSLNIVTDKNLGIPENLSWRYEKTKNFVNTFKKNMEDGFQDVKGRIVFIRQVLSNFQFK